MLQLNLSENIRNNIRQRIKDSNQNVFSLEKQAGLATNSVRNILDQRSLNPGIETLYAIANTLGCTINDLIGNFTDTPEDKTSIKKEQANTAINLKLFSEITNMIINNLATKTNTMALGQLLDLIERTYDYFASKQKEQADYAVIEYLIDVALEK